MLSAQPQAYPVSATDLLQDIPADTVVQRAFALDSARHLSLKGHYLRLWALPDRWISWWFGAVPAGRRLLHRYRPQVIWSTYPIATAHLIGLTLHRLSGVPWVADLRDPMISTGFPTDKLSLWVYRWIERQVVRHSSRVVCTTPGAVRDYQRRYPEAPPEKFVVIENGYDEHSFPSGPEPVPPAGPFLLLHSGVVYPAERDPACLFQALADLRSEGLLSSKQFCLLLRATAHDRRISEQVQQYGLADMVRIEPPIHYRAALAEMMQAHGLLILQGSSCNAQIPAKLYEYIRSGRPILALTDLAGDTATALSGCSSAVVAPLDDVAAIRATLLAFLDKVRTGQLPPPPMAERQAASRQSRATQLAELLDQVAQ
ncbi:glycosyltransferase [Pseudoduganella ginsengisoli]|nr:glycosyltransferase [Pseudoduganella ginsengisoli]